MELHTVKNILEAILLSVEKPMDLRQLNKLFEADEDNRPSSDQLLQAIQALQADYQGRGMELSEVASGYRIQVREDYTGWISRLWEEKAPRYSRALLETLVLIAYRQPVTRGEIEEIRGVSVSSHIMKTLLEREWVRVLGHKDVPGKPSMYGTTSGFLDYFNLKSLDELPPLSDIKDLDKLHPSLELEDEQAAKDGEAAESETSAEVNAESESEKAVEQNDAPDDSYQEGVEEADEEMDEILAQEKLAVSNNSTETVDIDEKIKETPEQDVEVTSGEAETEEVESISDAQSDDDSVEDDTEVASGEAETTEPETMSEAIVEMASEVGNSDGPVEETSEQDTQYEPGDEETVAFDSGDHTDEQMKDSTDAHAELVEENMDKEPRQEAQPVSYERHETADTDEPVAEITEQAAQPEPEMAEIVAPETIAEEVIEEAQNIDERLDDAAEDSSESDVEEADEAVDQKREQDEFAVSDEASGAAAMEEAAEEIMQRDVQKPAEEAKVTGLDTVTEAFVETELKTDNTDEWLDTVDDSVAVEVEAIDEGQNEESAQEKQAVSFEPSETAAVDEPVEEESPAQDVESEPDSERSGWTMLAQRFWERLKRLVQKGRKKEEKEQESRPEVSRIVEFLTSLCYTYRYV